MQLLIEMELIDDNTYIVRTIDDEALVDPVAVLSHGRRIAFARAIRQAHAHFTRQLATRD